MYCQALRSTAWPKRWNPDSKASSTVGDQRFRSRYAGALNPLASAERSEEHTSELQSLRHLVCRLLLEKKRNGQALSPTRSTIRHPQRMHQGAHQLRSAMNHHIHFHEAGANIFPIFF